MNRFFASLEKTANDLAKNVQDVWDDVKVSCPSQACRAVLKVPPGVQVFQCSACGTQVYAPTSTGQLGHHVNKLANSFSDVVDEVSGRSVPVTVVVPEGSAGGQTVAVPESVQGNLQVQAFQVVIPPGLVPGQSFVAQVPATTAKRLNVSSAAAAPETVPVAQPVDRQPVGSASPAADPVAPSSTPAPSAVQSAADAPATASSSASAVGASGIVRSMTGRLNEAGEQINRDLQAGSKQVVDTWNDFKIGCPSCQTVLAVPPGAQVFACGVCNVHINRPADTNQLGHHFERLGRSVGQAIDSAIDRRISVQVAVPEGKGPGDIVQVVASHLNGTGLCDVVVPEGMAPGQTFTAHVKASEVTLVPYSSTATAAPEAIPIAEIVAPGAQHSAAQPVSQSASQQAAQPSQPPAVPSGEKVQDGTVHSGAAASATDGSVVIGLPVQDNSLQAGTHLEGIGEVGKG